MSKTEFIDILVDQKIFVSRQENCLLCFCVHHGTVANGYENKYVVQTQNAATNLLLDWWFPKLFPGWRKLQLQKLGVFGTLTEIRKRGKGIAEQNLDVFLTYQGH